MATMADNVIAAGVENRPPMLEKGMYDRSFQFKMIDGAATKNSVAERRLQTLANLTPEEKLRKTCDIKALNNIILGLPIDIYTLVNHVTPR
ncbi:hypothetical protein Tco_0520715 [Tanacetum coccineum]